MKATPIAIAGLAVVCATAANIALAADSGGPADAFVRDSEITVHLRSYYLDRRRPPGAAESEAWAGGGWLGYQSGWLGNVFRVGVTGYTSQRIWGPPETDGTSLLKPGQESYSVLGQAYASLKLADQVFTAGRQLVDLPEVNPQDNRMTPNTFQGYTAAGKLGGVGYFAGYLDKMKTRNDDKFRDFATVAGAPVGVSEGMWLAGLDFKPHERLVLRLSPYYVPDVLSSIYADAEWRLPLAKDMELRLAAQYMYQSSVGDDRLTGFPFHAQAGGLRADLVFAAFTLTAAYTQAGRSQDYRAPYGTWPGYTSMIVEDFNRAGEKALLVGASYDFARHGLPGLSMFGNAVFGGDAVNPVTGAGASDKTEYDGTVDYRFSDKGWPAWLRPLWIRARAVRVEEKLGATSVTNDYRVIVNYEWVFK
jgi:hypothetical protein